MKKRPVFFIVLFAMLGLLIYFMIPNSGMSGEKVFDKFKNSVVLVRAVTIYRLDFNNDKSVYFSDFDQKGIKGGAMYVATYIVGDKEPKASDYKVSFGTGFFVSKDGKIITNRHVINEISKADKESIIGNLKKEMTLYSGLFDLAVDSSPGTEEFNLEDGTTITRTQIQIVKLLFDALNSQSQNVKISTEIVALGVALNATHVDNAKDFIDCKSIKTEHKEEVDLALLQTKSQKLPEGVKDFIALPTAREARRLRYKEGSKVLIIGYNYGASSIGNTSQGLKVQRLEGTITQETDDYKVQYEASTLHGSSGSPVFSSRGKLIGVNYAGIEGEQIKYGLKVKHLNKFLSTDNDSEETDE